MNEVFPVPDALSSLIAKYVFILDSQDKRTGQYKTVTAT